LVENIQKKQKKNLEKIIKEREIQTMEKTKVRKQRQKLDYQKLVKDGGQIK
jgi:hypothetical protein